MFALMDLTDAPTRILKLLEKPLPAPSAGDVTFTPSGQKWLGEAMRRTCDGRGDATGFWLACQLIIDAYNGASVDVYGVLHEYARLATVNPLDPFDEQSVQRWARQALRSRIVARGEVARRRVA
jgi:hypothetical protein